MVEVVVFEVGEGIIYIHGEGIMMMDVIVLEEWCEGHFCNWICNKKGIML